MSNRFKFSVEFLCGDGRIIPPITNFSDFATINDNDRREDAMQSTVENRFGQHDLTVLNWCKVGTASTLWGTYQIYTGIFADSSDNQYWFTVSYQIDNTD